MRGNNAGKTSVQGFVKRTNERFADANVQGLKRREGAGGSNHYLFARYGKLVFGFIATLRYMLHNNPCFCRMPFRWCSNNVSKETLPPKSESPS